MMDEVKKDIVNSEKQENLEKSEVLHDPAEIKVAKISGLGEFAETAEKERTLYYKGEKVFLVVNKNTVEVRTDEKLSELLREKYESVMGSRYFGRGGIEIVLTEQLSKAEVEDLVRLSYNLTN